MIRASIVLYVVGAVGSLTGLASLGENILLSAEPGIGLFFVSIAVLWAGVLVEAYEDGSFKESSRSPV